MALGLAPARPVGMIEVDRAPPPRSVGVGILTPLSRTLVLAAAFTGVGEVALSRVAMPVISHIPGPSEGSPMVDGIGAVSEMLVDATAVLVLLAAAVLAFGTWRRHRLLSGLIGAAAGSTLVAAVLPGDIAAASHILVIGAVVFIGATVAERAPGWNAVAVGMLCIGVVAGQWLLLMESLSVSGAGADVTLASRALAEGSFLLAPIAFAAALLRRKPQSPAAWYGAVTAAMLAAAVISARPDYAAIMSLWAVGATLSFPPVLYVASAACIGLLVGSWVMRPSTRHLAVGLALLAVAGLQPAVVHHNLTALVAVVLLATPLRESDHDLSEGVACRT